MTDPMVLSARAVDARDFEETETYVVTVAEHDDGTGWFISFQLGHEFDEQDRRLGQDTYCTTTSDGDTAYGGITSVERASSTVTVGFTPEAADKTGLDEAVVFELPNEATATALLQGLEQVTTGFREGPAS